MALTTEAIAQGLGTKKTRINSTATFLVFKPSLYTATFSATSSGGSDLGLRLPCARLEAVPMQGGGQAFVTTLPLGDWMSTETSAAHVLVVGGRAGALLTIYRPSDVVDMPSIEFRSVLKTGDAVASAPPPSSSGPCAAEDPGVDIRLSVNPQDAGETLASNGNWSAVRD